MTSHSADTSSDASQRPKAVILLSGGLDSVTALAVAMQTHDCYTLSFDYGQCATAELNAARRVAEQSNVVEHRVATIDLGVLGGSALTDKDIGIPDAAAIESDLDHAIPITYVPARNTIFLSYALAWAEVLNADAIFIGVNAVDYSGYPDCRPEYIAAFQSMASLATKQGIEGRDVQIITPLIDLSKEQIIVLGTRLGVDYAQTVSCYQADDHGAACGICDSCFLRQQGFAAANLADPTVYQGKATL
ncbi:MAG: 7-cyano-7-deazaguanine synthase QueC [Pseudomonadota bacterium]